MEVFQTQSKNFILLVRGVARIFQRGGGGVTRALCQTLSSWRFRHGILYVVCLKKGLQRGGGGHGHPRTPLATPLLVPYQFFFI